MSDRMLEKQDRMLEKQDETIFKLEEIRSDIVLEIKTSREDVVAKLDENREAIVGEITEKKESLDERLKRIESDISLLKSKVGIRSFIHQYLRQLISHHRQGARDIACL